MTQLLITAILIALFVTVLVVGLHYAKQADKPYKEAVKEETWREARERYKHAQEDEWQLQFNNLLGKETQKGSNAYYVRVGNQALAKRDKPLILARRTGVCYPNEQIAVKSWVASKSSAAGNNIWLKTTDNKYVWSGGVVPPDLKQIPREDRPELG